MALNARQERFVAEYCVDMNATQAAIRAGYSARTANEQASRLLANVNIRAAVDRRLAKTAAKLELTAEMYIDAQWKLAQRWVDSDEPQGANVASTAMERAAKAVGFLREKVETSGEHVVRVIRE